MSLQRALNLIKKYDRFMVASHVGPDPDAVSSTLVMALFLKSWGKKVVVVNEDPLPSRYDFFPKAHLFQSVEDRDVPSCEVLVTVDCGDLDRIGVVKDHWFGGKIINIDHHVTNTKYGDVNCVMPNASSTAEVLYDLLKKARVTLNKDYARLLYLGIMTDTGSFRYDGTSAYTHKVVAELMKFNIPVDDYYRFIYEKSSREDMCAFIKILNKVEFSRGGRVATLDVTRKIKSRFSEQFDLREQVYGFLRSMIGVDVIVIFTEQQEPALTRVNFRSQCSDIDVAKIAAQFGGGGHKKASGCSLNKPLKQTKHKILKAINLKK